VRSDVLYNVSAVVVCGLMSVVQFVCSSGVRSDMLYNVSAVVVCRLMSVVQFVCSSGVPSDVCCTICLQ